MYYSGRRSYLDLSKYLRKNSSLRRGTAPFNTRGARVPCGTRHRAARVGDWDAPPNPPSLAALEHAFVISYSLLITYYY